MTTIIERPSSDGGGGGLVVIALVVGALAAGVIGLFAFGAFDGRGVAPASTSITVEQPPAAAAPMAPATTPPSQNAAPAEQPAPAPDAPAPDTAPTEPAPAPE